MVWVRSLEQRNIYYNSQDNIIELFKARNEKTKRKNNKLTLEEILKGTQDAIEIMQQLQEYTLILSEEKINSKDDVLNQQKMDILVNKELVDKSYSKEELEMKLFKTNELNKINVTFMLISTSLIIVSLMGLLVFSIRGSLIIHPFIFIVGILMGIGWGATAITSMIYNRRKI